MNLKLCLFQPLLILNQIPLQQGLKPGTKPHSTNSIFFILNQIPLQQGLKQPKKKGRR